MARINIYDIDPASGDKTIVGWFDPKWLIASEYDAAEIEQITDTEAPEERGPGRPQVGDRPYKLVMPETMLASIDERADRDGVSRAEWIRRALAAALEGAAQKIGPLP